MASMGARPRAFLLRGNLRDKQPAWRVDDTCDPAEVAVAWVQHRAIQVLIGSNVDILRMAEALGESPNSVRAKLRGDRAMGLVDLLRWAMCVEPRLMTVLPSELHDISVLLPPGVGQRLTTRQPGGYRRIAFEVRRGTVDWTSAVALPLSAWLQEAIDRGHAWSITGPVVRGEVIELLLRAGVPASAMLPLNGRDAGFAIVRGRRTELVTVTCVALAGGSLPELTRTFTETIAGMWTVAMGSDGPVIHVIVGSPPAVQMISGIMQSDRDSDTQVVSFAVANEAGVPDVNESWPDLRVDAIASGHPSVLVYSIEAKDGRPRPPE